MLIVGEKEADEQKVSVRKQGDGDQGVMAIGDFITYFKKEMDF
jgi:threonyl-tRNA synthetase